MADGAGDPGIRLCPEAGPGAKQASVETWALAGLRVGWTLGLQEDIWKVGDISLWLTADLSSLEAPDPAMLPGRTATSKA